MRYHSRLVGVVWLLLFGTRSALKEASQICDVGSIERNECRADLDEVIKMTASASEGSTRAERNPVVSSGKEDFEARLSQEPKTHPLVAWVRSFEGGFVSEKLSFKAEGEVFATADIDEDEVLIVLPRGAPLRLFSDEDDEDAFCSIIVDLVDQYLTSGNGEEEDAGEFIDHTPYISYLFQYVAPNFRRPQQWSDEARKLMTDVIGNEIEPRGFGDPVGESFAMDCDDTELYKYGDDEMDEQADYLHEVLWHLIQARSFAGNSIMLPLYDSIEHRNGIWHNIDFLQVKYHSPNNEDSHDPGWAFKIGAIRNISAGESIHSSWNQCHFPKICPEGMDMEYMTPQIFNNEGVVEDYPRRFGFTTGYDKYDVGLIVEIEEQDMILVQRRKNAVIAPKNITSDTTRSASKALVVNWLTEKPSSLQLNFVHAHFNRLERMQFWERVEEELSHRPYESRMVTEYYLALKTVLEQVYLQGRGEGPKLLRLDEEDEEVGGNNNNTIRTPFQGHEPASCIFPPSIDGDNTCPYYQGLADYFDDLDNRPDPLEYQFDIANCWRDYPTAFVAGEDIKSFYQLIEIEHYLNMRTGQRDTCLHLAGIPQSCTCFRPHYHEVLIHYSASFLDKVERVLFMGGGDLMILHEILKYPNLEFVYGMELDQQVVRESFRSYGIQPSFDDPRVRWRFGDAAKGILTIPEEYYGTFDLVLLDLMSYVADTVMVGEGISLFDMAMRLLKPDGVMAQNRDFAQREKPTARYAVDLVVGNIPLFCYEYINIASNGINFANKTTTDHKVHSLFYEPGSNEYYSTWTNFHHSDIELASKRDSVDGTKNEFGLLTVMEAENATISLVDPDIMKEAIRKAIAESSLTELNFTSYSVLEGNYSFSSSFTFVLQEGYITIRTAKDQQYIAMDLLLWQDFYKQETTVLKLFEAVGSCSEGPCSSYGLTIGGMSGREHLTAPVNSTGRAEVPSKTDNAQEPDGACDIESFFTIVRAFLDIFSSGSRRLILLCGEVDSPCPSLEALAGSYGPTEALPFWTCTGLSTNSTNVLLDCEESNRNELMRLRRLGEKFSGIVIDPGTSKAFGQVFHKILNSTVFRREIMADEFFVFAPIVKQEVHPWRGGFMERLRAEMIVFNPVHHVNAYAGNSSNRLNIELFSAGNSLFYFYLKKFSEQLQNGLGWDFLIRRGNSGVVSYTPEFSATKPVFNDDYDTSASFAQWLSQKVYAKQEVVQMELEQLLYPLLINESVLVNYEANHFAVQWVQAKILNKITDTIYEVKTDFNGEIMRLERHEIRKLESSTSELYKGERLLVKIPRKTVEQGEADDLETITSVIWRQGYVMNRNRDGTYQVRIMTLDKDWVIDAKREDVIRQIEDFAPLEVSRQLSCPKINLSLKAAIGALEIEATETTFENVGLGCILLALWGKGSILVSWDGGRHVDLNIFTYQDEAASVGKIFREAFVDELDLSVVGLDVMPRGLGRVINFPISQDQTWFGQFHKE